MEGVLSLPALPSEGPVCGPGRDQPNYSKERGAARCSRAAANRQRAAAEAALLLQLPEDRSLL